MWHRACQQSSQLGRRLPFSFSSILYSYWLIQEALFSFQEGEKKKSVIVSDVYILKLFKNNSVKFNLCYCSKNNWPVLYYLVYKSEALEISLKRNLETSIKTRLLCVIFGKWEVEGRENREQQWKKLGVWDSGWPNGRKCFFWYSGYFGYFQVNCKKIKIEVWGQILPIFLRLVCFVLDLNAIEKEVSSPLRLDK